MRLSENVYSDYKAIDQEMKVDSRSRNLYMYTCRYYRKNLYFKI